MYQSRFLIKTLVTITSTSLKACETKFQKKKSAKII